MNMDRKQFIVQVSILAGGFPCLCSGKGSDTPQGERKVNAGPVSNFAADGLYVGLRDKGFFVIRKGPKLVVLSSMCTHRKCRLSGAPDQSFFCDCHGSTFDSSGKVTEGPATRDLPEFASFTDTNGYLIVIVPAA